MPKVASFMSTCILATILVQCCLIVGCTANTKQKRVTRRVVRQSPPSSTDSAKTWTLSPAVIGIPVNISTVVELTRPISRLSDIRLRTTCGCIKAKAALVPHDNKKVKLDFIYQAKPPEGNAVERILVLSNKGDSHILGRIVIEAEKRYPLSIEPKVVDFGRVLADHSQKTVTVTVRSYTNLMTPKSIASSPKWLISKLTRHTSKESQFKFFISSQATPGPLTGTIVFKADTPKDNASVDVVGYVEGDIIATPIEVQFPTIQEARITFPVKVALSPHTRKKSLPELTAQSDSTLVEVHICKLSKTSAKVVLVLNRQKAHSGINKGSVILKETNGASVLTIPYRFIRLD